LRRLALVVVVLAAGLVAGTAGATWTAGPPRGLTPNGRVLWNLDALVNDTFGDRVECYDGKRFAIFSVRHGGYCPPPEARFQTYVFTFLSAHQSAFRLIRLSRAPNTGVTNVPLRIDNRFVSCPGGRYHHGGSGWLVQGGGRPPNRQFWCN
jgi:hypothetical protein